MSSIAPLACIKSPKEPCFIIKIFDIILAMTNGQWTTEVLANLMSDWMFRGGGDSGRGSLMAIVIMIGVIPIMIWNIRRHKEDEKS